MGCFGVSQSGGDLPLDAEQLIIGELVLDGVLAQNGEKIGLGGRLKLLPPRAAGVGAHKRDPLQASNGRPNGLRLRP